MKTKGLKVMFNMLLVLGIIMSLCACQSQKPQKEVLEDYIASYLGDTAKIQSFQAISFEKQKNYGIAQCQAEYEKDNVLIKKDFEIMCEKDNGEWTAKKTVREDLKSAVPLAGISEDTLTENSDGWQVTIEEHHTDLEQLSDEITITRTQEGDGVKRVVVSKNYYVFADESWQLDHSEELKNSIEPTSGVSEEIVLSAYEGGKITEHNTDLANKTDIIVIEQVQENSFFKYIVTTTKKYEFTDEAWQEAESETGEKFVNVNLTGTWQGKENVTTALDSSINGTYDVELTIHELSENGQIQGTIKCRAGNFDFESQLEQTDGVYFTTSYSGYDFKIQTGSNSSQLKIWAWNYGGINDPKIEVDGLQKMTD